MRDVISAKEKRPAITEEQLFDTCNKYFEQHGKEPSQKIIQGIIGGSPVTIGPLLRAWKEKKENDEEAILEMPDHIRDGGVAIIATWWQSIQPTLNDIITSTQLLANEKVGKAQIELNNVITNQAWLEKENSKLETAAIKDKRRIEALDRKLARFEKKYAKEHTDAEVKLAKVEGERDAFKKLIPPYTNHNKDNDA